MSVKKKPKISTGFPHLGNSRLLNSAPKFTDKLNQQPTYVSVLAVSTITPKTPMMDSAAAIATITPTPLQNAKDIAIPAKVRRMLRSVTK